MMINFGALAFIDELRHFSWAIFKSSLEKELIKMRRKIKEPT